MTLTCQLYKPSVWRWIDSCQNQASANKYRKLTAWPSRGFRWKTGRFDVKFCISSTSLVSAVSRMAAPTLQEKKTKKPAQSFLRLNFNVFINVGNRGKAGARNKTTETNLVGRKHKNFIAAVRKWEMLAATKVKISGSEKQSEQEHKHFLHETCN